MIRRCVAALALATLLGAATARAQSIRGIVFHADSATRAAGIIVLAVDERSNAVGRTLSGADGAFDVRVPAAGSYVLRLLRIGYRPTVLPAMDVRADGVNDVLAVLHAEAIALAAVTVRSENVCGSTEDAGRVIAQLWEEARKALAATELSIGAGTIDAEWRAFQFSMDRRGLRASNQEVLARRGPTERPFVSASAADLASDGYVLEEQGSWLFRAPDAIALLSDQFAATHCFHVEPPQTIRSHWIGIAFRPTPARARVRDIAGTLWLDRATSELRLLEFRYENLPPEAVDALVGGYVEYARLPTGHWLVARWAIRMPRLARRTIGGAAVPGGGRQDRQVLVGIDVGGGELVDAERAGTILFVADSSLLSAEGSSSTRPSRPSNCGAGARPGVTLSGTVNRSGQRVGGAAVRVAWAGAATADSIALATVADANGVFLLPCVAPGVPLTVSVVAGDARSGPLRVGALTDRSTLIDVDIVAPPPGGGIWQEHSRGIR